MISCINERNFIYAEIRDIQSFYQEAIAWAFMNDMDYVISSNMNDYASDLDLCITSSNIPELGEMVPRLDPGIPRIMYHDEVYMHTINIVISLDG